MCVSQEGHPNIVLVLTNSHKASPCNAKLPIGCGWITSKMSVSTQLATLITADSKNIKPFLWSWPRSILNDTKTSNDHTAYCKKCKSTAVMKNDYMFMCTCVEISVHAVNTVSIRSFEICYCISADDHSLAIDDHLMTWLAHLQSQCKI